VTPAAPRVACAHNDLLLELAAFHREDDPFRARWLPVLERGGVGLQVCAVWVDASDLPERGLRCALEQVRAFHRAVGANPDRAVHVRSRADLDLVEPGERLGLLLALEGAEPLGSDPAMVEVFRELGVRMVGLTWMRRNAFADGNAEPEGGGLSRLGAKLVARLVSLGIAVDLAHASDRTFRDVLELTGPAPLLVSHAGCRALVPSPRNVPDELLAEIAAREGFFGVMCHPYALGAGSTIEDVCLHLEHAAAVVGASRVGLGGDFTRQIGRSGAVGPPRDIELPPGTGLDDAVEGLAGPEDYPALAAALAGRGHDEAAVAGFMGANLRRFLRSALS